MTASAKRFVHFALHLACVWYCIDGPELRPALSAPPPQANRYAVVFSDEFDTLDLGFKERDSAPHAHKWYEGVWFSQHHSPRQNFTVENSAISLTWQRGQAQPDSSISTFSLHNPHYHAWRYGYFEARMKWRPKTGAWPAFWLIPVQAALAGQPPESGEIDIFEGQASEPNTFFGTIHRWLGSQQLASTAAHNRFHLPAKTDFAEFHTYGLLWVPGRVTWYFDNAPLHSEPTYEVFDRQDYFIVLGMQEGVDWKEGDLTGVDSPSLTLTVDWVRVWQLDSK